jgi:hypothetical protein
MEFFNHPQNGPEDLNPINIENLPSNNVQDQLYKFLLREMQKNSYFADKAFEVGLFQMSDIEDMDINNWIELISFIHNKTKEQVLFKYLIRYEDTINDEENRETLHSINQQLRKVKFSSGGNKTRKNKRRCKKRSKRHYRK